MYTAEQFGQPAAEQLNQRVWGRVAGLAARDLIRRFGLTERGLNGFVELLRLCPWTLLIGYHLEVGESEVWLRVPCCSSQVARRHRGLGEYACKEMHRAEFESIAREVAPRICVECRFAPLDPYPENCFCEWRFSLAPQTEA